MEGRGWGVESGALSSPCGIPRSRLKVSRGVLGAQRKATSSKATQAAASNRLHTPAAALLAWCRRGVNGQLAGTQLPQEAA